MHICTLIWKTGFQSNLIMEVFVFILPQMVHGTVCEAGKIQPCGIKSKSQFSPLHLFLQPQISSAYLSFSWISSLAYLSGSRAVLIADTQDPKFVNRFLLLSTWEGLSDISAIQTVWTQWETKTCLICKFPPHPLLFPLFGPQREKENQLKEHVTERDSEPFSAEVNGELLYENDSVNIA